jgi:4-carboxymuconolactone decarboxylase
MHPRIAPLDPPYEPDVEALLTKMMPPGSSIDPLKLFRTLVRNRELAGRMLPLAAGILGRSSSIDPRDREIVIDRVCARCGCEYEWGVHAAIFGEALGIASDVLAATANAAATDPVWSNRDRLLIRLVDELHDTAHVSDELWAEISMVFSEAQMIELLTMVGWYHAISFIANAARVPFEDWAARFPSA